ncbi:DUF1772 domain-containing protein [Streptomyces phytohabitans]|uniref:anthrone oxygenase family protein n=1 Tax=Streptomyces phytohabitans TaxID=1150371 RepID=UPI00345BA39F
MTWIRTTATRTATTRTATAPSPHGGALRTGVPLAATLTAGLTAGVFADWSNAIMPALAGVDDRTFVAAYRALDASITNPLFLGAGFTGSLLLTAWALVLQLRSGRRESVAWLGAALVCCLVVWAVTFGVHEPLNERLRTAGGPGGDGDPAADPAAVRALLDEARWLAWNTVRAVAATLAFGCLAWTLVLHRPGDRADDVPTR